MMNSELIPHNDDDDELDRQSSREFDEVESCQTPVPCPELVILCRLTLMVMERSLQHLPAIKLRISSLPNLSFTYTCTYIPILNYSILLAQ